VPRIDKWLSEEPRRPPAEIACLLARDRFWKDEPQRLIGTHRDWPDAAYLLDLNEEFAHAFVLALSRLPTASRQRLADTFYDQRVAHPSSLPQDDRERRSLGATVALMVAEIDDDPEIFDERVLDLLRGAAQGDDLARTPLPAVADLQQTLGRIRLTWKADDLADASGAAALALAEVLDPSSGIVDLKEVLARSAWFAAETLEPSELLRFLLDVDRLLAGT
jgi:hypothetical protein